MFKHAIIHANLQYLPLRSLPLFYQQIHNPMSKTKYLASKQ